MTEEEAEAIIRMVDAKIHAAIASSRPMHQRFAGHEEILLDAEIEEQRFRNLIERNNSMTQDIRE